MRLPAALRPIRRVSQIRQYTEAAVPDDVVDALLELARWTGSSRNVQPWHFIVVRDRGTLAKIAALRSNITWLAGAPLGIAIVLDVDHAYDEGRVTERILSGATMLGYGGGVAWYGEEDKEREAKRLLGIPDEKFAHQIIAIGRPKSKDDPRPTGPKRGRKPLADRVHRERW